MSTTETENYTDQKVDTFTGKKFKWTGKLIRSGCWPENPKDTTYSIGVYETKNQTLVAWIVDYVGGVFDVVYADTDKNLIEELSRHAWANEECFIAALQDAFPDEDIWVEEIE